MERAGALGPCHKFLETLISEDLGDPKTGGRGAAEKRKQCPRFAAALDDFYLLLVQPQAIEWREQSKGWRFCQRVFAIEYRRIQSRQQTRQSDMMEVFLKAMARRG